MDEEEGEEKADGEMEKEEPSSSSSDDAPSTLKGCVIAVCIYPST